MARNLSYEDIRNLPLPDLALKLLNSLDSESNFNNFIRGAVATWGGSQESSVFIV